MPLNSLVMGFGGTGAHILTHLKELSVFTHGEQPESVEFLLFDTVANWNPGKTVQIMGGTGEEKLADSHEEATSLNPSSQYFYLEDKFLKRYVYEILAPNSLEADDHSHMKYWLHAPWFGLRMPNDKLNIQEGCAQQRQIVRFAIFQNVTNIENYITRTLYDLSRGGETVNVWFVGSSAGGTGAGSMLDAAFMTRRVVERHNIQGVQLSSVIVFPDIYSDKVGISKGRAYSFFRELNRFQEVECGARIDHRYTVAGKEYSSEVIYDHRKQQRALVKSNLFDNLFYLGKTCRSDEERENFFMSAANAMSLYMNSGQLFEGAINNRFFRAASSFGAARIYIPQETYAELFAWEEVCKGLELLIAPKVEQDVGTNVYAGNADIRKQEAYKKVRNLLPLFDELLQLDDEMEEILYGFAKNRLLPKDIISQWYQLENANLLGAEISVAEIQQIRLAYINPLLSLTEPDTAGIDLKTYRLKSFKENKKASGAKEDQKASRNRFAQELEQLIKIYTGNNRESFNAGRQLVFNKALKITNEKIDQLIQYELARESNISVDEERSEQGTPMTRLYHELLWIINNDQNVGPLAKIKQIITVFLTSLDDETNTRTHQVIDATRKLRDVKPSFWGSWVEEPQKSAREECEHYILWYQKRELLKDMLKLINEAHQRFQQWADAFQGAIHTLVISQTRQQSALDNIRENIRRLNNRLYRLSRNQSALISCAPLGDVDMQGYRQILHQHALEQETQSLAKNFAQASRWHVSLSHKGKPRLRLSVELLGQQFGQHLVNLHQELLHFFKEKIKLKLDRHDIFDYLLYAQDKKNFSPESVAKLLHESSEVLLDSDATTEVAWVYKDPEYTAKMNYMTTLQSALLNIGGELLTVKNTHEKHFDKNSLILLKTSKPASDQIHNVKDCLNDYLNDQNLDIGSGWHAKEELYHAQVYHPFRPELEAWYIERWYMRRLGRMVKARDHISPRIVRLLEYPDRMQVFVQCIATGIIRKNPRSRLWEFDDKRNHHLTRLTTPNEPSADMVRAAIIFVLQQMEAKVVTMHKIELSHAQESVREAAQEKNEIMEQLVADFVGTPENPSAALSQYIQDHFRSDGLPVGQPEMEIQHLIMIFQFYGDPNRGTELADRLELP